MADLIFSKTNGTLTWGNNSYNAVSGPHGKGALDAGAYTIKVRHVAAGKNMNSGFRDKLTGKAWFIPITPDFVTNRNGFGIHPDGGVAGTLGCIGLTGADAGRFWKNWNATNMSSRGTSLEVKN